MNQAYIHVLLNHFPVLGFFFSVFFTAAAWISGNLTLRRSALIMIVFTSLMTIPVYLSGDGAEKIVENFPNVTQQLIYDHEEFADKAVWLIWATGIFAAVGLFAFNKKKSPAWFFPALVLLGIASFAAAAWTNKLGGMISHPEFRSDKQKTNQSYEIDKE